MGTGLVGAPACGDVMKLQIEVDEKTGKIVDAKFKTFGCGSAIASSSLATEWIKGRNVDDAGSIKNTDIAKELSLPPVKLHCSSKYFARGCSSFTRAVTTIPNVCYHCSAGRGRHQGCSQGLQDEAREGCGSELTLEPSSVPFLRHC